MKTIGLQASIFNSQELLREKHCVFVEKGSGGIDPEFQELLDRLGQSTDSLCETFIKKIEDLAGPVRDADSERDELVKQILGDLRIIGAIEIRVNWVDEILTKADESVRLTEDFGKLERAKNEFRGWLEQAKQTKDGAELEIQEKTREDLKQTADITRASIIKVLKLSKVLTDFTKEVLPDESKQKDEPFGDLLSDILGEDEEEEREEFPTIKSQGVGINGFDDDSFGSSLGTGFLLWP